MIGPTVVTAAAAAPIDVADVKANSYITVSTDDDLIQTMIDAVVASYEEQAGVALQTQTLEVAFETWPDGRGFKLPRYPLQSVTSIIYTDKDGASTTWDSSNYVVDTRSEPGRVRLAYSASWPTAILQPGPAIVVRYVVGFGDEASDVPANILRDLVSWVGAMYEHREEIVIQAGATKVDLGWLRNGIWNARRF